MRVTQKCWPLFFFSGRAKLDGALKGREATNGGNFWSSDEKAVATSRIPLCFTDHISTYDCVAYNLENALVENGGSKIVFDLKYYSLHMGSNSTLFRYHNLTLAEVNDQTRLHIYTYLY